SSCAGSTAGGNTPGCSTSTRSRHDALRISPGSCPAVEALARYRVPPARGYVRSAMRIFLAACALVLFLVPHALYAQSTPASERPIAGLGHAHMDTSCSAGASSDFDRALALLHNFWYTRALEAFSSVAHRDPHSAIPAGDA